MKNPCLRYSTELWLSPVIIMLINVLTAVLTP